MPRRRQSNSSSKNFFIVLLLLIVAGFCYYNFSNLFLKKNISNTIATSTAKVSAHRESKTVSNTPIVNDTFDIAGNTFPVIGTVGHTASGDLRIVPLHGITTIQFEKLNFTTASDLHLYLSKDKSNKDIIDLGLIKGSKGTVSYNIPETASPEYRFVLTWSTKQNTLFNYVEIPQNPI